MTVLAKVGPGWNNPPPLLLFRRFDLNGAPIGISLKGLVIVTLGVPGHLLKKWSCLSSATLLSISISLILLIFWPKFCSTWKKLFGPRCFSRRGFNCLTVGGMAVVVCSCWACGFPAGGKWVGAIVEGDGVGGGGGSVAIVVEGGVVVLLATGLGEWWLFLI